MGNGSNIIFAGIKMTQEKKMRKNAKFVSDNAWPVWKLTNQISKNMMGKDAAYVKTSHANKMTES